MSQIPVNWRNAVLLQKRIAFGKMMAAKKAVVCGKGRGMCAFQHKVLRCSNEFLLRSRVAAPKKEYDRLFAIIQLLDDVIGKRSPADIFVAVSLSASYCQRCVEQQYTVLCPWCQRAVLGWVNPEITFEFFEYVLQAGGWRYAGLNGEA